MVEKRRLPVISNNAPPAAEVTDEAAEKPPWHWVPLGALISIVVGAVLARSFFMPFMQRQVEAVYGRVADRAEYERIDAHLSSSVRDALQLKLAAASLVVALLSVAIGAFVVGRFGPNTNRRHGTLAGITAMTLLVLFAGSNLGASGVLSYMMLIPFGGIVGYLGAFGGVWFRTRAQQGH